MGQDVLQPQRSQSHRHRRRLEIGKGLAVGGAGFRTIWEVWNANKLNFGDRYCAGLLFWYHNSPLRQTGSRMWDWSLEPTAALYYSQDALEPLHAQFDYLSNTVTVVNDYYKAFKGYTVTADVYDFNLKKVVTKQTKVDLPEDGLAHKVLTLDIPADITPVHFIKLTLTDDKGAFVSDTFYWRSTSVYKGKKTLTGPCTAGFEDLTKLPAATLKAAHAVRTEGGSTFIGVSVENAGSTLAFMAQLQLLDKDNKPVRPSFYTDNFFSLLPGEKRTVTIETESANLKGGDALVVKGWNAAPQKMPVRQYSRWPILLQSACGASRMIRDLRTPRGGVPTRRGGAVRAMEGERPREPREA